MQLGQQLSTIDKPIAVWDIESKKIAMYFLTARELMQVLFKMSPNQMVYWISEKKRQVHSGREICFRYAKPEDVAKLPKLTGGQKGYLFDSRFQVDGSMKKIFTK